jgi:hypothetical protein
MNEINLIFNPLKKTWKHFVSILILDGRRIIAVLEGCQESPACIPYKNIFKIMIMSIEQLWNDSEREIRNPVPASLSPSQIALCMYVCMAHKDSVKMRYWVKNYCFPLSSGRQNFAIWSLATHKTFKGIFEITVICCGNDTKNRNTTWGKKVELFNSVSDGWTGLQF